MSSQIETTIQVQLENRNRVTVALRLLTSIPAVLFLASFDSWSSTSSTNASQDVGFAAGFLFLPLVLALVFAGKYPSYVFAFNKALMGLNTRVSAYVFLLTDKYPTIEDNDSVKITFPEIEGGSKLNRYLPLVKWLLALPLYIVGIVYALYGLVLVVFSWFSILLTGRMPESCATGLVKITQYWNRVLGYALVLVTDEYPTFSL